VWLICAGILAAQFWQSVDKRDDWPLSSYPMYSGIQGKSASRWRVLGVDQNGSFELKGKHLAPLAGARMRHLLRRVRKDPRPVLHTLARRFAERGELGRHDRQGLLALRLYQDRWHIKRDAGNRNSPRSKLRSVHVILGQGLRQRLALEASGKATGGPRERPRQSDDIVLEAELGSLHGKARVVPDAMASEGRAVLFQGPSASRSALPKPRAALDLEFRAPPGHYRVWLRGKSAAGRGQDSVWLQFDKDMGSARVLGETGAGHFREAYPAGAFMWSSAKPGFPALGLSLRKGGRHRLRIALHQGPVMIDQVLLSPGRQTMLDGGGVIR